MKNSLNMLRRTMHSIISRWIGRIGASLRRATGRPAKPEHAPQHWQGGQVI